MYWDLINDIVKQPTVIQHWIDECHFVHKNDFDEFFLIAHKDQAALSHPLRALIVKKTPTAMALAGQSATFKTLV